MFYAAVLHSGCEWKSCELNKECIKGGFFSVIDFCEQGQNVDGVMKFQVSFERFYNYEHFMDFQAAAHWP